MSNGNSKTSPPPSLAYYDFYKTNGTRSSEFAVLPGGPSLTRQEFAEECDINVLMKRYDQAGTGVNFLPRDPNLVPQYVDFGSAPATLLEFMDLMQSADKAFMTLPATVRREFDNDPTMFVDFASDPANLDRMREWGLAAPKAPEVPKSSPAASSPPGLDDRPGGVAAPVEGGPAHGSS